MGYSSFDNGACIVSNGGGGGGSAGSTAMLSFRNVRQARMRHLLLTEIRLFMEKNNTRGKTGQSMPRQTVSYQAYSNEDPCKMYFNFTWDDEEYYLSGSQPQ